MSNNFLDLDALVPSDKTVKIEGQEYTVDGSYKVQIVLELEKVREELEEDPQSKGKMKETLEKILPFFQKHHPEMDRETLAGMLYPKQLFALIEFLFSGGPTSEPVAEDADPND